MKSTIKKCISLSEHKTVETMNYSQKIGEDWIVHLEQLQQLKQFAKDVNFQRAVQKVKQENKLKLAQLLQKDYGVKVNPASMFDIQVSPAVTYAMYRAAVFRISDGYFASDVLRYSLFDICGLFAHRPVH